MTLTGRVTGGDRTGVDADPADALPAGADPIDPAEVAAAVTEFLADEAPNQETRRIAELLSEGFSRSRWRTLSLEVGIGGLVVPRPLDGVGAGLAHAAAAVEAAARAGSPAPVRSTLAAALVCAAATDPPVETLRALATDAAVGAVALDAEMTYDADAGTVAGHLPVVTDAPGSDYLLVVPRSAADPVLLVDLSGPGVATARLGAVDVTHSYGAVDLRDTPATVLAGVTADHATDVVRVLVAAEHVGAARAALAMAVEYARTREQFGRVIGTYQAVSHRLADTAVDIEGAAALTDSALDAITHGGHTYLPGPLPPLAAAHAARVSLAATATAIATLGGIGFTWEHDAHFGFRRVRALAAELGTPADLENIAVRRGGWAQVMTG